MVKIIISDGKETFACEQCKAAYTDKWLADECERWCKAHNIPNTEFTEQAVKKLI